MVQKCPLMLDPRIPILRSRCLERKKYLPPVDGDPRLVVRALQETGAYGTKQVESWTLKRGLITRYLLENLAFSVDNLELLLGRLAPDRPEEAASLQAERQSARAILEENFPHFYTPGQTGHCQLDLSRLFEQGIDGLMATLVLRRDAATGGKAETYQSFIDALSGFSNMIENAGAVAQSSIETASPERAAELERMALDCNWIAHRPPASFRQALQLAWLAILACQYADRAWLVVPGHLDRILGSYYQADLEKGDLTPEAALVLIESLYILINETVPDGLAVSVMVGGRDASGQDLTNPLSYLCLEALRRSRLVYPTVGVCWHPGTPQALTDLAVELMASGIPNPAFFGDETIQQGLQSYGVPADESWNYINSTCVEITPVGSSNVWVASPYFSTNQILLDQIAWEALSPQEASAAQPAPDFSAFLERYRARLSREIAKAVDNENANRRMRWQHGGKPLQSVFTRDCIDRGQDIDRGGARYNWVECSFVGLANLADGLFVLNQEIFEQKRLSMSQLHAILAADFSGFEPERQRFLNRYPKYGNDHIEVDRLVGETVDFIRAECSRYAMEPDDSPYVPGAFCWVMHEVLGRQCGATPDGRRAGFPFADGCGPAQGRERSGPTAAVLSTTSWCASDLIGGAAFNMKFARSLFADPHASLGAGSRSVQRLKDLVLTFLQRGGFETQVNVVDAEVLRQAQAHPEEFRDLVVRIGGYTDYFTRLTPEMQAEVILRTEYSIP